MTKNLSKPVSEKILDLIELMQESENTEYERGILTGLRVAECLVETIERNSKVVVDNE